MPTNELIALQEMIAHQSREIAALSDELYLQQKALRDCRAAIDVLQARLRQLSSSDSPIRHPDEETPPPHY